MLSHYVVGRSMFLFVAQQCVTALNNTWHPEHFFCAHCNNYFGEDGFHEHDGKPYCRADFYNLFAPHCASCEKPILSNYISALNAKWHPECFVCGVSLCMAAALFCICVCLLFFDLVMEARHKTVI